MNDATLKFYHFENQTFHNMYTSFQKKFEEIKNDEDKYKHKYDKYEEEWHKNQTKLLNSQLRGIDFHFTEMKVTSTSLKTLVAMSNLRYLRIQQIENTRLKETLCLVLKNVTQIEELKLECQAYFLTTYPKNNLALWIPENAKDKIGFKVCSYSHDMKDDFFNLSASYLSLSFNYTLVEIADLESRVLEIDGSDYTWAIHLKDIKHVKDSDFIETSMQKEDYENLRFNILLPIQTASVDLINLKIRDEFIEYLQERTFSDEK